MISVDRRSFAVAPLAGGDGVRIEVWLALACTADPAPRPAPEPVESWACWADYLYDRDADGSIDGWGRDRFDDTWPSVTVYAERDLDGDGMLDFVDTRALDGSGRVVHYERAFAGASATDWTYDRRGNPTSEVVDLGADGAPDHVVRMTWDRNDEVLHYERDDDADGRLDQVVDYERGPTGLRLRATEDYDGDGAIDRSYAWTYDARGRELAALTDHGDDGTVDEVRSYAYSDPELRVGTAAIDVGADGTADGRAAFAYDADGRELYVAEDPDLVDPWELEQRTTWDDRGRELATERWAAGVDGMWHQVTRYGWDDVDRVVETSDLVEHDGVVVLASASRWDVHCDGLTGP